MSNALTLDFDLHKVNLQKEKEREKKRFVACRGLYIV